MNQDGEAAEPRTEKRRRVIDDPADRRRYLADERVETRIVAPR